MRRSLIWLVAGIVLGSTPFVALREDVSAQSSSETPRGRVRLVNRSLADDRGPWLPLGASLFWALWAERHDPERLDRNLAWLAERGVDYVRVLGMVGSESWSDRRIDPRDAEYWATVDRLFERLGRHGLRAQVTIFADAQAMMPRRTDRRAFVEAWAARAEKHRPRLLLVEIANEYSQNGLEDVAELRALGRRCVRCLRGIGGACRDRALFADPPRRRAVAAHSCAMELAGRLRRRLPRPSAGGDQQRAHRPAVERRGR
jgi:hypothetical protein